jgi:hypothetical protein
MSTNDETKPARKYKVRPTPRQRRAAKIMADIATGKRTDIQSQGQIVLAAGYTEVNALQPSRILDTEGVKDALAEYGFNEKTAKQVVSNILNSTEAMNKDRLKAADMVFKVHGTYAAEKHVSLNIDAQVDDARLLELAQRLRNA